MKTTFTRRFYKSVLMLITTLLAGSWSMAQSVSDPSVDPDYDSQKQSRTTQLRQTNGTSSSEAAQNSSLERSSVAAALTKATSACFIPLDASYTALPRNDDGSFGPIALPFTFDLYGASYTQVWINTNGNLTFTGPYSAYSASGFPFSIPMVAPFWGDVDTRNTAGGQIHYKLSATNLVVTWDNVGYYSQQVDKLNEFQVVISDGVDPITGLGQNVCFNYGDMQWTTGSASSGVNGFGGTPATVGVNKGNNIDFYQLGRFNQNNSAYDGPGGNPDGINYLDQQCYCSQVSSAVNIAPIANNFPSGVINIDCGETYNLNFSFIPPEVNQTVSTTVNVNGACGTTFSSTSGSLSDVSFSLLGQQCNEGTNVITFTATDNGTPVETTTVTLTINVATCCDLTASSIGQDESCANQSDGSITISTTGGMAPLSYSIDGGATYTSNSVFTGLPTGTYVVIAQDMNGCESVPQTIQIFGPPALTASSSATAIDCNGGTATVTVTASGGTPPYSGTGNFTVNAGPYSYTVTDANGCSATTTGSVTEPTPLVVTADGGGGGQTGPCLGQNTAVNGDFQSYTGSIQQGNNWINNNLDNWSVSHGTPSGFGNLRMWMWSYYGAGEGMYMNHNFVAGQEYQITYDIYQYTDANPTSQFFVRLNNNLTPSSGSTSMPSTAGTQIVSNLGWNFSGVTQTITETFVAGSNYSQLWFHPYLAGAPTPNQSAAWIDNVVIQEVLPCNGGGILCNGGTTDITVAATGGTAPYTGTGTYNVGAGNYSYPVVDANGCTETVSVTVTESDPLVLSISATEILCNGETTDITVSATGGTAPYTGTGTFTESAGMYTYTVTDDNGCTETISITVTEPSLLVASATAAVIPCLGATTDVTVTATGGTPPYTGDGIYNVLAGTYTYTVTDSKGCTSDVSITVTEDDNIPPVAICQDLIIDLDAAGNASITANDIDNGSNDACGIASLSIDQSTFDCSNVGANTVTLTVVDNGGNTSTCTATVTVNDNVAPTAVCQDLIIDLDAAGNASITAGDVDNGSSDACGIASLTVSQTSFDCSHVGSNTVTLTLVDNNGNTSTCTSTVTVNDNVAPNAVCQDLIIDLDAAGNASITAGDVDNGSSDACGIASLTIDQGSFDCSNVGTNTITLTVVDNNGNTSTCTSTVTVNDNVAPIAICQDLIIDLDAAGNASITANDVDNGSNDACGIASLTIDQGSFDCSNVGANTITLTVVDNNGNTSTCTSTVTVNDNIAPTAICQDLTVTLDANGNASVTAGDIDNGSFDNCGIASLSIIGGTTSYTCNDVESTFPVTLLVTDVNGNTSSCVSQVTVGGTQLVASVSATEILCFGETTDITVTATGGALPYSGTGTFTELAGTYSYTVTDAQSCTSDVTITVTEPTLLTASATATQILCNGETTDITVVGSGGTPPYTGDGVYTELAGTYTYTVTDSKGCTADVTITVTEPTQLELDLAGCSIVYSGLGWAYACATIDGTASEGTPAYSYAWSTGEATPSITVCPDSTTTYSLTVTDGLGCTVTETWTVQVVDIICSNNGSSSSSGSNSNSGSNSGSANGSGSSSASGPTYPSAPSCPSVATSGSNSNSGSGSGSNDNNSNGSASSNSGSNASSGSGSGCNLPNDGNSNCAGGGSSNNNSGNNSASNNTSVLMCFNGVTYCVKYKNIDKKLACGYTLGPCDAQQSAACDNSVPTDTLAGASCVCSGRLASITVRYIGPANGSVNASAKSCGVPISSTSGLNTGAIFYVNASDGGLQYLRNTTYLEVAGSSNGMIAIPTNCCNNPVGRTFFPFQVIGWVDTQGNTCGTVNNGGGGGINGMQTTIGQADRDSQLNIKKATISQFPNPASTNATFEFTVPASDVVTVSIVNIRGELIGTIFSEEIEADRAYTVSHDVSELQSGIYFVHMNTSEGVIKKKFVVLK